jgi:histone H3/H4
MENFVMAKRKTKSKSSKKKTKEPLVVASKVKAYIKKKKMMSSGEAVEALNESLYDIIDEAVERTKANRRSTVKAQDV